MQISDEIEAFFEKGMQEVREAMEDAGQQGVDYNIENGDYHNITGNLRRSNYYEVTDDRLVVGNSAEYASDVEARGRMVSSDGALLAYRILQEKFK